MIYYLLQKGYKIMISVPHDIQTRFQTLLASKAVPKKYHFHYKRWLRYYWDFCHKYGCVNGVKPWLAHFDTISDIALPWATV